MNKRGEDTVWAPSGRTAEQTTLYEALETVEMNFFSSGLGVVGPVYTWTVLLSLTYLDRGYL